MANELKIVDDIYFVREKWLRQSERGHPYLRLELTNGNRRVIGQYWQEPDQWYNKVHHEMPLQIRGKQYFLDDKPYLEILRLTPVTHSPPPVTYHSNWPEPLQPWLSGMAPEYQELINTVFDASDIALLHSHPAGKRFAFARPGGLLERTVALLNQCPTDEGFQRNVWVTAVFLQMVGFLRVYQYSRVIDLTPWGRLFSVRETVIARVSPVALKSSLNHAHALNVIHCAAMIPDAELSTPPALTLEAVKLSQITLMVMKADAFLQEQKKPENQRRAWSAYNRYFRGRLLLKSENRQS